MMDYCVRESTLNEREEIGKDQTIKMSIQETYKILREMNSSLHEFDEIRWRQV